MNYRRRLAWRVGEGGSISGIAAGYPGRRHARGWLLGRPWSSGGRTPGGGTSLPCVLFFLLWGGLWAGTAFPLRLQAPRSGFEHLSLEDGLSQSVVNGICQDRRGFLWFATQDGLNRYDGYRFVVFRNDANDPNSISDNLAYCLHLDQQGDLWIGTDVGLNRYDRRSGRFVRYDFTRVNPGVEGINRIASICRDARGILWLATRRGGILAFDPSTGRSFHFAPDPKDDRKVPDHLLRCMLLAEDGFLWVGTAEGVLCRLDRGTGQVRRFPLNRVFGESRKPSEVWSIFQYGRDRLWIGTNLGLVELNTRSGEVRDLKGLFGSSGPATPVVVNMMMRSRSGELWIGTTTGIYRLGKDLALKNTYRRDARIADSLSQDNINILFEDDAGVLWVGTYSGGINKLDLKRERFAHFPSHDWEPGSLSNPFVLGFLEDQSGRLWVGTENGLNRWDDSTQRFDHFFHEPNNPRSLSNSNIQSLCQDREGVIWVGTSHGLNRLDPGKSDFVRYLREEKDPQSLSSNDILCLLEDRHGQFWVGTYSAGLCRMDRRTGKFTTFQADPGDPRKLCDNYISCLLEDRSGTLWIGTNGGLNQYHPGTGTFSRIEVNPADLRKLGNSRIRCLYEDSRGYLWVGTRNGLYLMNRATGAFARFTMKDGLPNNVVYGICEDTQGFLWLSTNHGLSRFDPFSRKFRNYDAMDGLQSSEFNQWAYCRLRSGELLFGGINGFSLFRPEAIVDNPHVPPVVLTGFKLFGRDARLPQDVTETVNITLRHTENSFSFEFAALDYTNPRKNQYAYMLEGFDSGYIEAGTSRVATYTNLEGGEYFFRVKGTNSDGVTNDQGVVIRVNIVPPFWRTTWFRIATIVGLAVLLNLVFFGGRRLWRAYVVWKRSTYVAHFRVLGTLGRGGMGVVYKAVNIVNRQVVALKVLDQGLGDETSRKRFVQEGLICERIKHPNVVAIYERGEHNDRMYFSMEYLEGMTLRRLLNDGPFEERAAVALFAFLFDVLCDIHRQGVIHRDIKPENIMISRGFSQGSLSHSRAPKSLLQEQIKLLDFGLARFADSKSLTEAGSVAGTLSYLPPEMLGGERVVGPEADFYSLGVILYEMLTGTRPFQGDDNLSIMFSIMYRDPIPPHEVKAGLSTATSDLVMKLIAKKREDRLTGEAAIREMLGGGIEGHSPDR